MTELELTNLEEEAETFYHGTRRDYLEEQLKKQGMYMHDNGNPVSISISEEFAMSIALKRAKDYKDLPDSDPVVLIIYGDKIRDKIYKTYRFSTCIDHLLQDEFYVEIVE